MPTWLMSFSTCTTRAGFWERLVSAGRRSAHTARISMDILREIFPGLLIYLLIIRHRQASTLTQFIPLLIFFMRLFESWGVQTAPKEPARPEAGNSRGIFAYFSSHAWKSYWELKSVLATVFWQLVWRLLKFM